MLWLWKQPFCVDLKRDIPTNSHRRRWSDTPPPFKILLSVLRDKPTDLVIAIRSVWLLLLLRLWSLSGFHKIASIADKIGENRKPESCNISFTPFLSKTALWLQGPLWSFRPLKSGSHMIAAIQDRALTKLKLISEINCSISVMKFTRRLERDNFSFSHTIYYLFIAISFNFISYSSTFRFTLLLGR